MNRRKLLALAGMVPLAGCSGGSSDAVVRVEQVADAENIEITFSELPSNERHIIKTAVEEDFYHVCSDIPEAVHSLANRIESKDPYLEYKGDPYALYISIADQVYALTASPPEDKPSCGIL